MLDPPAETPWAVKWDQVHEMFKFQRFWKVTLTRWEQDVDQANKNVVQWSHHTWTVLEQFTFHAAYNWLSQKMLKFYGELQKTAAACALTPVDQGPAGHPICRVRREDWRASYDLIVSAGAPRNTRAHWIDLVPSFFFFFFPSYPGRLKPF